MLPWYKTRVKIELHQAHHWCSFQLSTLNLQANQTLGISNYAKKLNKNKKDISVTQKLFSRLKMDLQCQDF